MKRPHAFLALCLCLGTLLAASADAQQAPGPTKAEVHKARGYHAWKRAAWRATPALLPHVIRELEAAQAAAGSEFDASVGFMLGYCYLRLDRADEATEILSRTLEVVPEFAGYPLLDALQLQQMERHADALKALDRLFEQKDAIRANELFGPELEFLGLLLRGQSLLAVLRNQEAAAVLEQALEHSEKHLGEGAPAAKILLARARVKLDEFSVAEALLLEVLAGDPGNALHYYHLGLIHADQLDYPKAAYWYQQAVARDPAYPEPYIKLAFIDGEEARFASMRRNLERYRALLQARHPAGSTLPATDQADIEAGLGKYWRLVGNAREEAGTDEAAVEAWTQAAVHYKAALAARPDCSASLDGLVKLLPRIGARPEEIAEYVKRLRELKSSESQGAKSHRTTFC